MFLVLYGKRKPWIYYAIKIHFYMFIFLIPHFFSNLTCIFCYQLLKVSDEHHSAVMDNIDTLILFEGVNSNMIQKHLRSH
jgi:hypothetical protein